jgi:hypothetical protein
VIDDIAHSAISNTKILSNRSNGNIGNGIQLVDPLDGVTVTTLKYNTANGNGGQGIDVTFDPLLHAVHTNKASGNIGSPQCDANLC